MEFCNLWLKQGDHISKQGFYVTNLGRDRIILGHLWFHSFNPSINWETNQLEGDEVEIETVGYRGKSWIPKPTIDTIDAPSESPIDPSIPPYYHRHWKVFDETASYRFPPARRDDHPINLKPGAPDTLDCKIYRLTEVELQTTKDFIRDELAKGYIEESNSPYTSPLFYQAKKDGKLHPIIDYKALNSWTICDTYPLPLISDIIDHLQGKSLFTKFDIQWGYNNICIKEEDRWKAAFKTPFGLYQPKVMYFGLTNSPPTFCRAMVYIFRCYNKDLHDWFYLFLRVLILESLWLTPLSFYRPLAPLFSWLMRSSLLWLRAAPYCTLLHTVTYCCSDAIVLVTSIVDITLLFSYSI